MYEFKLEHYSYCNVQENPLATIASYDARLCHGSTVDFTVTVSSVATTDAWTLVYTLDGTTETTTGTGAGTFSVTTTKQLQVLQMY